MLLLLLGCTAQSAESIAPPPPPPPAPVPLVLAVNPGARRATAQPGASAPSDNAAITLTGDNSSLATWTATAQHAWIAMTTGSGTGSGTASWNRITTGLATGIYVDSIRFNVTGAIGSPSYVIDTLQITTAPVPLVLVVGPHSRNVSAIQGGAAPDDNVAITLAGDNAATTAWSATKRKAWTTLVAPGGTGSGTLNWHRSTATLAIGTYVDTITITAAGAGGSPIAVIDTLRIVAAPVTLTIAVAPSSRSAIVTQGGTAAATSAAVVLAGDNATTTGWTATKKKAWTTLTIASGTGTGSVGWARNTASLGVGTYIDTISVTAAGANGSPATVIDTIVVTPPIGGIVADLGLNGNFNGKQVFPSNNPWNQPVDTAQKDPNSDLILNGIGPLKSLHPDFGSNPPTNDFGYTYIVVPDATPRVTFTFDYPGESDVGPYPMPANPPIEGGGDAHLFVITQGEWKLYELYNVRQVGGQWQAGSGAIFDLANGTQRPAGWTSADAAGLPMIPGMVRYEEVYGQGVINHALRFTVNLSQHAYVFPATHYAASSTNPLRPPMGMRVRLRTDFDISGYSAGNQVILRALKKYGMMVADNGGDFFVSGITDPRWDNDVNNLLKAVKVGDFEVVKMVNVITN